MQVWQVQMLGGLVARAGGAEIRRFRTRQTAALLAYLAFYPGVSRSRDELAELLWPDAATDLQRRNLRQAIFFLRRHLEPSDGGGAPAVVSDFAGVRINAAAVRTDTAEFEQLAASSMHSDLILAAGLYQGPLLPSFTEGWIEPERQRLRDLYLGILRRLMRASAEQRDFESAIGFAHRAAQEDPYREESHRALMQLYVATGRPHAAREQFDELNRRLNELGVGASAESIELAAGLPAAPPVETADRRPGREKARPPAALPQPSVPLEAREARSSLPIPLTRLFGRAAELGNVCELLRGGSRLVTLVGPGGIGKTRLALETARAMSEHFGEWTHFVSLADVRDAGQIADTVLASMRFDRQENESALDQLIHSLQGDPLLLVLDNYEQLLPSGKVVPLSLLKSAPNVTLLITSRTRVNIAGEMTVEVPLLPVSTEQSESTDLKDQAAGVQMFVDRAQAVRPDFRLTFRNFADVTQLVRKLDGLPLAIELAAARMGTHTAAQVQVGLIERFSLLSSSRLDRGHRHRSLWAAIAWSVDLLPQDQRRFFSDLSVFRSGFTSESAAAVALDGTIQEACEQSDRARTAADMLDRLRAQSLIVEEEQDGDLRYGLLEAIREFAEELVSPEETAGLLRRHADFFATVGDRASDFLKQGATQQMRKLIDLEYANMVAALTWSSQPGSDPEPGCHLAAPLSYYWLATGRVVEGRKRLAELDAAGVETMADRPRASLLSAIGNLAMQQDDLDGAFKYFEASRQLFARVGDQRESTTVSGDVAAVLMKRGRLAEAEGYLRECVDYHRSSGEQDALAGMLNYLGHCSRWKGDLDAAHQCWQEALEINRRTGHREWTANNLQNLGNVAFDLGDPDEMRRCYAESAAIREELNDNLGLCYSSQHRALLALIDGDLGEARRALLKCVELDRGQQSIAIQAWLAILGTRLALDELRADAAVDLYTWFSTNLGRKAHVRGAGVKRFVDQLESDISAVSGSRYARSQHSRAKELSWPEVFLAAIYAE